MKALILTSLYKFPHGHAVAVCMTEVWKYIFGHKDKCIDVRGTEYLNSTFDEISKLIDYDWYCDLLKKLGIQNPIALNREAELKILVQSVNLERLRNTPVELDTDALKKMYERIVK